MTRASSSWPALSLRFPGSVEGPLSNQDLALSALVGLDVLAIEEHSNEEWDVYFRSAVARSAAMAALDATAGLRVEMRPVEIEDEDWAGRSQAELRSIRVGRMLVSPPWDLPADQASGDVLIVVEPSMGFGTGHHASTRLCLEALQQVDVNGARAIDIGTGSGVLAMAAARLGAATVEAIDVDPDAIRSAARNLALNGLSGSIDLRLADFRARAPRPADIVLANLTGGLIAASAHSLLAACTPGGHLIMSGILATEESGVMSAFGSAVAPRWRGTEDEWVGLLLEAV